MRAMTALCAVALTFAVSACAGGKSASAPAAAGDADSILADSLDLSAYDDLFAAKHARLMKEIEGRKETGIPETLILEALSIAAAGEEMYLRGKLDLAVKLLDEASRNLERKH